MAGGRFRVFVALALWTSLGAACAGTKSRASASGGTSGEIGSGGSAFLGKGGAVDARGGTTDGAGAVIGSTALGDAACASASQMAEVVPLDIYIMMDKSGSMADPIATNSTTTKWNAVSSALTTFFQDGQSAGIGVGIQYFPQVQSGVPDSCQSNGDCGAYGPCGVITTCSAPSSGTVTTCASDSDCVGQGTCVRLGECGPANALSACAPPGTGETCTNGYPCQPVPGYCQARDLCDTGPYATPAVEIAPLPGAAAALIASINAQTPDGSTPTAAALSGAIMHAQAHAAANPTHKVVVLLATDGLPDECTPNDINGVAAIASAGAAATPTIATYVIGVLSPDEMATEQSNLSTLASAGGTGQAFIVTTNNQNVTQSFVTALNSIRSSGLSCQYTVPAVTGDGGQADYFAVNVQFTSGSGQTVTIGNVKDRAACNTTQGGWYYDVDPSTGAVPSTITICDTSCTQMKADAAGRVEILLGCQTVVIVG